MGHLGLVQLYKQKYSTLRGIQTHELLHPNQALYPQGQSATAGNNKIYKIGPPGHTTISALIFH